MLTTVTSLGMAFRNSRSRGFGTVEQMGIDDLRVNVLKEDVLKKYVMALPHVTAPKSHQNIAIFTH